MGSFDYMDCRVFRLYGLPCVFRLYGLPCNTLLLADSPNSRQHRNGSRTPSSALKVSTVFKAGLGRFIHDPEFSQLVLIQDDKEIVVHWNALEKIRLQRNALARLQPKALVCPVAEGCFDRSEFLSVLVIHSGFHINRADRAAGVVLNDVLQPDVVSSVSIPSLFRLGLSAQGENIGAVPRQRRLRNDRDLPFLRLQIRYTLRGGSRL